jgi:retinol dehydrogenase 12
MSLFNSNIAINFDDFNYHNNYSWDLAYSRSKIANILFTRQLQAKMNEEGIQGGAYSLHPGVVYTDIGRDGGVLNTIFKTIFFPMQAVFMKTAWEGAQTTLHLALEDDAKLEKGAYYTDCHKAPTTHFCNSMVNAARLWRISEDLLGIKFQP